MTFSYSHSSVLGIYDLQHVKEASEVSYFKIYCFSFISFLLSSFSYHRHLLKWIDVISIEHTNPRTYIGIILQMHMLAFKVSFILKAQQQ